MGWYVHHVNLQANDVRQSAAFFRDIVGLQVGKWNLPGAVEDIGQTSDNFVYFGSGNRGLHVGRPQPSFAKDYGLIHNPTIGGHFAITVPDLDAVKARLTAAGIVFSDAGVYAMTGVHQIYCYDPSMNLVEINAIVDPSGGVGPAEGEEQPVRKEPGDWYIHHVNRQIHDMPRTAAFYRDIVGMPEGVFRTPGTGRAAKFDLSKDTFNTFGPDNRGLHIGKAVPTFHIDNGLMHNPTFGGHIAITVPDISAVMRRMDAAGHLYSDAGIYAMPGVHQLYTYEPSMNVVEINEVVD